jgi:hypothetical protein
MLTLLRGKKDYECGWGEEMRGAKHSKRGNGGKAFEKN